MGKIGDNGDFDRLLEYLQRARGFDFRGYKRAGLMRRIVRRMELVDVHAFDAYIDYLEVHPDEFALLFNTILINVTSFFRDPSVWEYVGERVLPELLAGKQPDQLRIWSAGCASGEEAYTIAILLAERLGIDAFCQRVKIYATDADEESLLQARQAIYSQRQVEDVPPALRDRYFEPANNSRFVFNKDMRRCVIFGRHDLIHDAPISKVDLLTCRNTLMYFNAEAQVRVLTRFHFALADAGFMVLGRAETMLTHANLFTPLDLRQRVFRKVSQVNLRERLLVLAQAGGVAPETVAIQNHDVLRAQAFDAGPVAQLIFDPDATLVAANERARGMFSLSIRDEGRPLHDLTIAYRPIELRSLIERAYTERRSVVRKQVECAVADGQRSFADVEIMPLFDPTGATLGVSVAYADVTRAVQFEQELQRSHEELQGAYEELQSTSEELETTNEELQSTVEELETMNEELQSTNEEMQTINDELRQRSEELNRTNAFLGSILTSLGTAVIVLDPDMVVQTWNHHAEDMWGLRADETRGKNFLNLDIGLPVEKLRQPVRNALYPASPDGHQVLVLPATNRRGKGIDVRIACSPLRGPEREIRGVILLMEEVDGG